MLDVRFSGKIQKELKLLEKRGYNMSKFTETVVALAQNKGMLKTFKDHPLKGSWSGYRECHITSNWLLIYKINDPTSELYLARTGTHSDLFNE